MAQPFAPRSAARQIFNDKEREHMASDPGVFGRYVSRRSVVKAGVASLIAGQVAMMDRLAVTPVRPSLASTATPSDIQFDIGAFVHPAQTFNDGAGNVVAQFGVTFTLFLPAVLTRTPTRSDQTVLANALNTIEQNFSFSPSGAFTFVHYGLPYFRRLPSSLVRDVHGKGIPRLLSDATRLALEEAVPSPTDVVQGLVGGPNAVIPNVTKQRFNVNVVIEQNDVLFQLRSDSVTNLNNIVAWLEGSNNLNGNAVASPAFNGLFSFQAARLQFVQPGLPRQVADNAAAFSPNFYEFHTRINPDSSMNMSEVDQQVNASASAPVVTFVGTSAGVFTNAEPGDYFDNGSIAHFSHDIEDLYQFYETPTQDTSGGGGEPFTERVQYMFRSNQLGTADGLPADGNTDQFTNGGGPAFINNVFQGTNDALRAARDSAGRFTSTNATQDATFTGLPRIGHIAGLQRSSRSAVDGSPLHIRNDGPGFDGMDVPAFQTFPTNGASVPAGTNQFKLQFLVFVPTAEFFRAMRANVAAQDLQSQFNVDGDDNGLERFITATRRQNFLTPPRRNRAFPLVEFT
jgi:hypothetical protein